ncbi:hypothetical protein G6O67_001536 [Ophiocordyceps sinensis]|uniref:Uncharacterized protein n=1 Tax=Ophiocordyceps sinensis TaxID=72228 RepID=A0A8H4V921_9HYPO|nr:hypothetical protein G6O67_001536 [Ophiocordyceps sinensis]
MDVVFHVVRSVVVDDEHQLLDVEAARRDRGCDEDGDDAILEVGNGRVTVHLILATVDGHARIPLDHELLEQIIRLFLPLHKDECASVLVSIVEFAEELQDAQELGRVLPDFHDLFNLLGHDAAPADGNLDGALEDLFDQRVDDSRHGGREENGLPVGPHVGEEFHHLGLKAHVEHSVGFVENHVGDPLEVRDSALVRGQQINHAAGGAHDDVGASLELCNLVTHRSPSIRTNGAQAHVPEKGLAVLVDLHRELARRRHDETDGSVRVLGRGLVFDVSKHGQEERNRLARARLGHPDDISPRHQGWYGLHLDGRGLLVAETADDVQRLTRQAALGPLLNRLWHIFALDFDVVELQAQVGHVGFRQAIQLRGLDPKVFANRLNLDFGVVGDGDVLLLAFVGHGKDVVRVAVCLFVKDILLVAKVCFWLLQLL